MNQVVLRERSLVGSVGYRGEIAAVMDLLDEDRLDLTGFVSAVVPLTDAVRWIHDPSSVADGLKVLVDPTM